jgi:hypothetical protein
VTGVDARHRPACSIGSVSQMCNISYTHASTRTYMHPPPTIFRWPSSILPPRRRQGNGRARRRAAGWPGRSFGPLPCASSGCAAQKPTDRGNEDVLSAGCMGWTFAVRIEGAALVSSTSRHAVFPGEHVSAFFRRRQRLMGHGQGSCVMMGSGGRERKEGRRGDVGRLGMEFWVGVRLLWTWACLCGWTEEREGWMMA